MGSNPTPSASTSVRIWLRLTQLDPHKVSETGRLKHQRGVPRTRQKFFKPGRGMPIAVSYGKGQGSRRRVRVVHGLWHSATSDDPVVLVADVDRPAPSGVGATTCGLHDPFTATDPIGFTHGLGSHAAEPGRGSR